MNDLSSITKKDVQDYLMANPEAEHVPVTPGACLLSNFFYDREGVRYDISYTYRHPRRAMSPLGSEQHRLPDWMTCVISAFDRLSPNHLAVEQPRFASWEVLAELDTVLKDGDA